MRARPAGAESPGTTALHCKMHGFPKVSTPRSPPGVVVESPRSPPEAHRVPTESPRKPHGIPMESPRSPCGVPVESLRSPHGDPREFPLRAHTSHPSHPHSHDARPISLPSQTQSYPIVSPSPPPCSHLTHRHPAPTHHSSTHLFPPAHPATTTPSRPAHTGPTLAPPKITTLLWYAWLRHFDDFPHCLHQAFSLEWQRSSSAPSAGLNMPQPRTERSQQNLTSALLVQMMARGCDAVWAQPDTLKHARVRAGRAASTPSLPQREWCRGRDRALPATERP